MAWCGTFSTTKDGLPFIGTWPGTKHIFFDLGYGGNGITFSMIGAQIIRNTLQGIKAVSYTHLDVYKRQILRQIFFPLYREVSLIVSIIGKLLYHQGLESPARRDNITDQRDLIFL